MRTGLGMDTLRVWERRYGFPKPERRPGSNRRLYSAVDVERLVLIASALDAGYRVGDVIDKSRLELEALVNPVTTRAGAERSRTFADVTELLELLAREDVAGLESALREGAAAFGPKRFVMDLAYPFAVRVGDAWAEGRLAVRHEHLASECLTTQLRHLLASYQDLEVRPLVLLTTLPGEQHSLALQMVALYLAVSGAKPRLLGTATPVEQIAAATRALHADIVGLTVTPSSNQREARNDLRALSRMLEDRKLIWVGGSAARAVDVRTDNVEVVDSWPVLDTALAAWRNRSSAH
jgi:MerR family transcriptional regulator, light-induced transcriptional regulator